MIGLKAWRGVVVLSLGVALGAAGQARADVLSFDDLPSDVGNGIIMPFDYGGFSWSNFYYLDGTSGLNNNSGFHNAVVSTNNVAYNFGGDAALLGLGSGYFTFNSVHLTGVWNDGLNIKIDGYKDGSLLYTQTVVVNTDQPYFLNVNYVDINALSFTASGGTSHGFTNGGTGTLFAMDDLTFNADAIGAVPEPSSMISAAAAVAAGLGYGARRRRRAA